ncbi:MAG: FMN-binding negative transcriptional regulator [Wenzhouxiangella sp.]
MHIPKSFQQTDIEAAHQIIAANPLATMIIATPSGVDVHHIPIEIRRSPKPYGTLAGHLNRASPARPTALDGSAVTFVFQGPSAYISPSWYASKKRDGRVVPTWNYVVVHASGVIKLKDCSRWIATHLAALSDQEEQRSRSSWRLSDAPAGYIEKLMEQVLGFEVTVVSLLAQFKLSQNKSAGDRAGVVAGLRARNRPTDDLMAQLVEAAGSKSPRPVD